MTIIVFGGTGSIGRAVVEQLRKQGTPVVSASRSGPDHEDGLVSHKVCDMRDSRQVRALVKPGDTVIHAAGVPYQHWKEQLPQMMHGLLAGVLGMDVHIVYVDNFYAYGLAGDGYVEGTDYHPVSQKGLCRALLAKDLQDFATLNHMAATILRSGDIYGVGVTNAILGETLWRRLRRRGRVALPVPVNVPHAFVPVGDVARAVQLVTEMPWRRDGAVEVFHTPSAGLVSVDDLVALGGKAIGRNVHARTIPEIMQRVVALFHPGLRELREQRYEFLRPVKVCSSRFRSKFTFTPTSHADAVRQTISATVA